MSINYRADDYNFNTGIITPNLGNGPARLAERAGSAVVETVSGIVRLATTKPVKKQKHDVISGGDTRIIQDSTIINIENLHVHY